MRRHDKTTVIQVRISPQIKQLAHERAKRDGHTLSYTLRMVATGYAFGRPTSLWGIRELPLHKLSRREVIDE